MTDHIANPALAEVHVEDMNRSAFIAKGALAVGAVYGMTMVGPFIRKAFAQGEMGDIDILNFALTLEYLEAAFYDQAKADGKYDAETTELVALIGKDEAEHVSALKATVSDLGGTPVEAPGVDFGNAFANQGSFLQLAQTFEDTGVSAYNGAGPSLKSKELLATAGTIVQVEARHAAAIRLLNGQPPAPDAFDPTLDMQQVLQAVDPFVV
ncbi:MAG: ferritin-like domain-containing protein [Actinomycetota bacterium]|nr:ferritin-like domain-containing protein [Actinomycetota bacterium]